VNKLVTLAVATLLPLALTACGGQEDEAKSSMSDSFRQQQVGGLDVDQEQADCMAGDIVDGVGVEQLKEYDILDEDGKVNDDLEDAQLNEEDADTVSAALVDCIGAETIVEEQVVQEEMTDPQKDCVRQAMGEDRLKGLISAGFQGADASDESVQELQEEMTSCMKK
jgi:hypothetical protein